jgi:ATP synthase protein I
MAQLPKGRFAMVSEADRARLEALEKRIAVAKKAVNPPRNPKEDQYSQAQLAWRMVIELVAGLAIGFGIGYGLDRLFGTLPIFLVLFIFAGLAAGVKTMLRSAKEVEKRRAAEAANEGDDGRGN